MQLPFFSSINNPSVILAWYIDDPIVLMPILHRFPIRPGAAAPCVPPEEVQRRLLDEREDWGSHTDPESYVETTVINAQHIVSASA